MKLFKSSYIAVIIFFCQANIVYSEKFGYYSFTNPNSYMAGKFCASQVRSGADALWAVFDGQRFFQYASYDSSGYGEYKVDGANVFLIYPGGEVELARIVGKTPQGSITAALYDGIVYSPAACKTQTQARSQQKSNQKAGRSYYSGPSLTMPSPEGGIGSGSYYSGDSYYEGTPYYSPGYGD